MTDPSNFFLNKMREIISKAITKYGSTRKVKKIKKASKDLVENR